MSDRRQPLFRGGRAVACLSYLFELCDRTSRGSDPSRRYLVPLFVQTALFILAIVVRSSVGYLVAVILVGALITFHQNRKTHVSNELLYRKAANSVIVAIIAASVLMALMPNYLNSGRTLGIFWHRAFISLSLHPDWPFGNLSELYPCRDDVPEGLTRAAGGDHIAHCVWTAYTRRLGRSVAEMNAGVHSSEYESVVRAAYWNAVSSYPWKAIELYTFYKPKILGYTLLTALHLQFDRTNVPIWLLLTFQITIFILFLVETYRSGKGTLPRQTTVMFAFSGVLSLLPGLVAWNVLATSVDTIFFMYAGAAIIITLVIEWILGTRQGQPLPAHAYPAGTPTEPA